MNIFVAKLSRSTRADDLVNLFSQFGEVLSAKIIVDRSTGHSKGYAFVEMAVEEEGEMAISSLNETTFMDSVIVAKKAHPRDEVPPPPKAVLRKRIHHQDQAAKILTNDSDDEDKDKDIASEENPEGGEVETNGNELP